MNSIKNQECLYREFPDWGKYYGRVISKDNNLFEITLAWNSERTVRKVDQSFFETVDIYDLVVLGDQNQNLILTKNFSKNIDVEKHINWNANQYQLWSLFLLKVRLFFIHKGFIEVPTPSLVVCPGTEPSLEVFKTEFFLDSKKKTYFLPTSPELNLKKYLSRGADKIFEIKPCFRNGEITERHQPEFTMIEWYRSFSTLQNIKNDVNDLIDFLSLDLELKSSAAKLNWSFPSKKPKQQNLAIKDLFLNLSKEFTPETTIDEMKSWMDHWGMKTQGQLSIDDCFFMIMNEKIEPQINPENVTFLCDYPPYQAALARITDQGWGDRFEVYWKGLELANAFHELNEPLVQRLRSQEDLIKKNHEGRTDIQLDEQFFNALEIGMPPSGGIALGLERLFMALFDRNDIRDCKPFSYEY